VLIMTMYKKVSKRTMDLLPVLKNRFPAIEDDIIISVVTLHNNSLIKATEALSEISGVSFNTAIRRGLRRKFKGCKVDRRGVPWSKMSLPTVIPDRPAGESTDMLSEEEFQKWLQEQLDQVEKERKEQQEAIQSNDVLTSSEDDQSWDDKSWEKLEFSKDDVPLLNQGDCSILDEFSVIVPESKETTSASIEMNVIHPAIPETDDERKTDPADSLNIISELLETDGDSIDCFESSILTETVTTSLFGDDLNETVYIHDEDQQIILKLVFENGSMYRFRVPRKSYSLDKLKRAVNDKLDQGYEDPVTALKIKYFDDEGDWITIASQEEWEEAVRIHKDVLKVHIM